MQKALFLAAALRPVFSAPGGCPLFSGPVFPKGPGRPGPQQSFMPLCAAPCPCIRTKGPCPAARHGQRPFFIRSSPATPARPRRRAGNGASARRARRAPCRQPVRQKEKAGHSEVTGLFGGGGWIRTTEGGANRFTVCPLWPLGNSSLFIWLLNASTKSSGAGERNRTINLLITNQLLCRLSYTSKSSGLSITIFCVNVKPLSAKKSLFSKILLPYARDACCGRPAAALAKGRPLQGPAFFTAPFPAGLPRRLPFQSSGR